MAIDKLTLDMLDEIIKQLPQAEIVGFVVSPADYRAIKTGSKRLYGVDDVKAFVSPPYQGLELYESTFALDGQPIPLRKNMRYPLW